MQKSGNHPLEPPERHSVVRFPQPVPNVAVVSPFSYPERPVGAPPVPRPSAGERATPEAAHRAFVLRAVAQGQSTSGHHNQNYVSQLSETMAGLLGRAPGTSVTVRVRRTEALPVVIRTWQNEAEILDAIKGILPHVPECLAKGDHFAIHSYVEGVPLSTVCGNGKPVDTLLIGALADLLAQMAQVRRGALPPLPSVWPSNDMDSQGFLRTLAYFADQQVRRPNWDAFGGLFAALGIPEDALVRLAERVPVMTRRPYSLLHADLHRDNLIMSYAGDSPLICVDWELATYGDPLHDLATHLVRMQYPAHQWDEVIDAWAQAMQRTRPAAVNGLTRDLRHYLAFERAQSVYPDVMRAAQSLEQASTQKSLDEATAEVRRALEAAEEPLRLKKLPGRSEIERALFRWLTPERPLLREGRDERPGGRSSDRQPDRRLHEDAESASAVREALASGREGRPWRAGSSGGPGTSTPWQVPSVLCRGRAAKAARRLRAPANGQFPHERRAAGHRAGRHRRCTGRSPGWAVSRRLFAIQ
ncbi:hypothetical protein SALBM311S_11670 [Streptomyces alboniger]